MYHLEKYFLNRLRQKLNRANRRSYKIVNLDEEEIQDLILWKLLLSKAAHSEIDINHITFTEPSIICYSDVCPHGLGGYIVNGSA